MTLDPHKDRTALRLRLYQAGFTPLPNKSKLSLMPGWSTVDVTPELIASWSERKAPEQRFRDTGLRCGDIIGLDFDIDDKDLLNQFLDGLIEEGVVVESPFVRIGRPPRELWVYRTNEPIGKRTTGHFMPPDPPADHKGFAVEVLGKGCQFAAYGQRDETTAYSWPDASLLDAQYMDLPVITKAQADAVKDYAIAFFERHGLERKSPEGGTDSGYTRVYDLEPDMVFEVHDLGEMTVEEIGEALRHGHEGEVLRCKVDALRPTSGSWAGMVSLVGGQVCLSDHGTYTSHFPIEGDIKRNMAKFGELLAARLERTQPVKEATPESSKIPLDLVTILDPRKPLDDNLALALKRYAYIEDGDTVHDIRRPQIGLKVQHFRNVVMQFYKAEQGPKGGDKVTRLADLWLQHPDRLNVLSVEMRPDQPWPLYEEENGLHLNTYRPVDLPDNLGDAGLGFDLIERLLPVESERVYFTRWLAYKVLHPGVRGPGIVMVAHDRYGTGRGSLISLVRSMFAPGLVQNIDFKTLSGQTYQSQYNEWLADSLIVAVDEAQETVANLSRWQTRSNAYEHLKSIVDPANHDITVVRKGVRNGPGKTFASIMVMTNHADAVVLPKNDRRFAVLENGEPQSQEYWDRFHAWRQKPENIAAFVAAIKEVDLGNYSPFTAPPMTESKAEMVASGSSVIDDLFNRAIAGFSNTLLTREQLVLRIEDDIADGNYDMLDDWPRLVERMFLRHTRRLPSGLPERFRIAGKQRTVRMVGRAPAEALRSAEAVLQEVALHGPLVREIKASGQVVQFKSR